jgi:flagellar biosynthesis protein FliR
MNSAFELWLFTSLLASLRLVPLFSFTPPFTLIRLPRLFRALFAVGVTAMIVGGGTGRLLPSVEPVRLIETAALELSLGLAFALPWHLLFGALNVAGRAIDIQSGLGIALTIDPTTRAQTPLVGTIFALLAAAMFFATDGTGQVLRIIATSLDLVPVGTAITLPTVAAVGAHATLMAGLALAAAGSVILTMLLLDVIIAVLTRSVPQMNALMLGIQVKVLVLLLVLPVILGSAMGLFARMMVLSLEAMARIS